MKRFHIILITVLFLATLVIAGTAQAQSLISSDGELQALASSEAAAGSSVSNAFKGKGGTAVEGLAAEGVITASVPMSELMALKPKTAEIGIETILGFDSRVRTYTQYVPPKGSRPHHLRFKPLHRLANR